MTTKKGRTVSVYSDDGLGRIGWIKPDGRMIVIGHSWEHGRAAQPFFPDSKDPEAAAEKSGWARLSSPSDYFAGVVLTRCAKPLTQAQQTTLAAWCERMGEDYAEYLIENELTCA